MAIKGVLVCGGTGSRLRPLTRTFNKNLLPVGPRPMIEYPLFKMKEVGIRKICVVSNEEHLGSVVSLLGSGSRYGVEFTYRIQEKPKGIADAIGLAKDFVRDDSFISILGDNLFDTPLHELAKFLTFNPTQAAVLTKQVTNPERFGVVKFKKGSTEIDEIVEKPQVAPSDLAVVGVYAYPADAFQYIQSLRPSKRGEYEITDLNNCYASEGRLHAFDMGDDFWIDAGTFPALRVANEWAWDADTILRHNILEMDEDGLN